MDCMTVIPPLPVGRHPWTPCVSRLRKLPSTKNASDDLHGAKTYAWQCRSQADAEKAKKVRKTPIL
jgi:hypothetical protein